MSTILTGSTATDPTTAPTATCPADGDSGTAASVDGPFQALLNGIAWLRNQAALWSGGTFTGAVNGVTPTAAANLVRKDYADGLITTLKAGGNTWTLQQTFSAGINASAVANNFLYTIILNALTTDPGILDGTINYRSDLAKVRARIAGVVQNLATEAYVAAALATPAWVGATLINGFTDAGAPYPSPRYRKDAAGTVYMECSINGGSWGAVAFVLPAGYRPFYTLFVNGTSAAGGSADTWKVDSSGNVIPVSGGAGPQTLTASFSADQ